MYIFSEEQIIGQTGILNKTPLPMEMFVMALGILGFTFNYNYMDLFE